MRIDECDQVHGGDQFRRRRELEFATQAYEGFLTRFPASEIRAAVRGRLGESYLAWGKLTHTQATTAQELADAVNHFDRALEHGTAPTRRATTREITKVWRTAQKGDRCRRADNYLAMADADGNSPSTRSIATTAQRRTPGELLRCARLRYEGKHYGVAITRLRMLLRKFPRAGSATAAAALLIDAEVASVRQGETGTLPTPNVAGSSASGQTDLIVRNDSPEELELLLSGPTSRRLVVPACHGCKEYEGTPRISGCESVPSRTLTLAPGRYDVVVRSPGTEVTPFSGTWTMAGGYRYGHCFYIVIRRGA